MSHLIISGGTRGIGRACVSLFAGKGYKVSSLSRTGTPDNAVEGVLYLQCDVRDPESVKSAVEKAIEENGPVDVLISNAGIAVSGLAQDFKYQDYRDVMDTNFGGLFNLASAVIPYMVRQGKGGLEDIGEAVLRLGANSLSYQRYLEEKEANGKKTTD